MGSISHHITPLVINSLWGRQTDRHTHTHTYTRPHRINSKKPDAPGLKNPPIYLVITRVGKLIIQYNRIFKCSFVNKIIHSFSFGIFLLALLIIIFTCIWPLV